MLLNIKRVLGFLIISLMIFSSMAIAQDTEMADINPGGCDNPESCGDYCSTNPDSCASYMNQRDATKAAGEEMQSEYNELPEQRKGEFKGPGNCAKPSDCMKFCNENPNDKDCQGKGKKGEERKHKSPPTECPKKVSEAGLCIEFSQALCLGLKYSLQRNIIDMLRATAQYFDDVSKEEGITVDTSQFLSVSNNVESKINELCAAGDKGFGPIMSEMLATFSEDKMNSAFNTAVQSVQSKFSEKMDAKYNELIKTSEEMKSITSSAGSSGPPDTGKIEELAKKLDSLGKELESMGDRMEAIFNGMESYAEQEVAKKDYSKLREEFVEKQTELSKKIADFHDTQLDEDIKKLEKRGFDVSVMKQVRDEIKAMQKEADQCVQSMDMTKDAPEECFSKLESSEGAWEEKIQKSMMYQIEEKYLNALKTLVPKVEMGIETAKSKNINTEKMEKSLQRIKTVIAIGNALDAKRKPAAGEGVRILDELQSAFNDLKTDWNELQAQLGGEENAQ